MTFFYAQFYTSQLNFITFAICKIKSKMNLKNLLKTIGPGLLWAGAAIGVSHLVQSTRAGALYGFELVWLILFFNLAKYPFFEFAPRYAIATNESLLHGYRRMGKWAIILYLILTFLTMFTLQAAITVVTAGVYSFVFPNVASSFYWAVGLLIIGVIILSIGKYSALDKLIKYVIVLLAFSTVIAVISAVFTDYKPDLNKARTFDWKFADIALLIAFAGWMPTAIDVSIWHSFWTIAKKKSSNYTPKMKEALFDFNVGYIGTALLSIAFLSLGALVMYGSGKEFSSNGAEFSGQLINLFTSNLGSWAFILIAIAALSTMTSTTLTCLDAYPRVLQPASELLFPKLKEKNKKIQWWFWIIFLVSGTITIMIFFMKSMRFMVDLATTLSFLTAPILAYLNYKTVTGKNVAKKHQPPYWLRILSWLGIIILTGFSIYYIIWKFII